MNNRILIVDDNPDIHTDFRKILCSKPETTELDNAAEALFGRPTTAKASPGYELTSAYQGQEAIDIVREQAREGRRFALAFVDVRMPPGLDGVETIKELWKIDPELEVVISTAYSDYSWEQLREKLEQADWLLILKKPFDNIEVLQLTKAMTRKWKLERDAQTQLTSLKRANALLEAQRETSIDGILVLDEAHRVLAYNGQFIKLWGITQALVATNDDNLILASVASKLKDPIVFYERMAHLKGHPQEPSRDEMALSDGRVFDAYSSPVGGGELQTFGRIWYFRDVTRERESARELRDARDAADNANQAKSAFLANMSHEIRTPMTAILGYADLLADEWEWNRALTSDQRTEYIRTIKRNGQHLLSIINDILDLSKIESGKMTVERIDTDPVNAINDVITLMEANAKARGLGLDVVYETPMPVKVQSDPVRMKQVLMNLVGNALKFTQSGGVKVHASLDVENPDNALLKFAVQDTGIGMTGEQLSRLFGAFEQADASTTRKFGGSGLGLRISKRLAQLLGGDIQVESEMNHGSLFTFWVGIGPLSGVQTTAVEPRPKTVQSEKAQGRNFLEPSVLSGARVLLAEDGPDNQRLIAFFLRKTGAQVDVAENGELAVRALTSDRTLDGPIATDDRYDLVLMDMQMPVLDGYSATRMLRSRGWKRPIIALTARAMEGDAAECLAAGCDAYATKPIQREDLVKLCVEWIEKSRAGTVKKVSEQPAPEPGLRSDYADNLRMSELIQDFVGGLPKRITLLEEHLALGRMEGIQRLAHQLSGAAGCYGFPAITQAARDLDEAIRAGKEAEALKGNVEKLVSICRRATLPTK